MLKQMIVHARLLIYTQLYKTITQTQCIVIFFLEGRINVTVESKRGYQKSLGSVQASEEDCSELGQLGYCFART
jgi:hypothetical protein